MLGGFNRVLHIVVELEKLSFDTLTSYEYILGNKNKFVAKNSIEISRDNPK